MLATVGVYAYIYCVYFLLFKYIYTYTAYTYIFLFFKVYTSSQDASDQDDDITFNQPAIEPN